MIVRTRTISFGVDRSPMPNRVRIGYEGDHLVERLEFVLPVIAENQTGFLMVAGDRANVIRLAKNEENGRDYVDLSASIIGAEGKVDCYVRIDGAGGETWQSGIIKMLVGDVPDVEMEVEREYPTAVSQMLGAIAEHDAQMEAQAEQIRIDKDMADEFASDAKGWAQSAMNAQAGTAADRADAMRFANQAAAYASAAAQRANAADDSAEAAAVSADRAELAAATQGYVFFEINEAGELLMTKTANVEELDFQLNDSGELEVVYG